MFKSRSVLSIIFHAICGAVCIQLTHSLLMIVSTPVLDIIIIKSNIWPICHCLELGHETMVCDICLYSNHAISYIGINWLIDSIPYLQYQFEKATCTKLL